MEVHHALSSGSYRILMDQDPKISDKPAEQENIKEIPAEQVESTTYAEKDVKNQLVAPVTDRGRLFDALF